MSPSDTAAPRNVLLSVFGVNPRKIGSGETYIHELSLQLNQAGWHHVVCFLREPAEAPRKYLSSPNVSLEVLPDAWQLGWKPAAGLWKLLRKHRPRILHLSFTGLLSPYPWIARWNGVEQVFFTDQASRPEGFVARRAPAWRRGITRLINCPLDRVIAISDFVRGCWTVAGLFPAARLTRIYNSVDLTAYHRVNGAEFRRRFGIMPDRQVAIQVAHVVPEKGFQDLIAAARIVVRENPRAHFVFVGDGPCRERYKQLAEEMGLANHVTWTGQITSPLEEGAFAAADIACQVSRWEEGAGWAIAEAMSFARPVIGTRVGAIPEMIENGRTGFLVERGDYQGIAERLLHLLADPELCRNLGIGARRMAEERLDLRVNVARLLELYGIEHRPASAAAAASVVASTRRD